MKKIAFYALWTILCLHTTVTFADAANDTIDDTLAEIDAIIAQSSIEIPGDDTTLSEIVPTEEVITLDAAPIGGIVTSNTPIVYTPWELIHRTAMMQGFTWGGEMANYVTPAMYIGTPLQTNQSTIGYNTDLGPTNYSECVRAETDASFGLDGELIEDTITDELRNIAKYCATEYLGSYFEGKAYTTREEVLMLLFTMFDEEIRIPGYFQGNSFEFTGEETQTEYSNVSSRSWYAPYLSLAYDLLMVEDEETWTIAREATDDDIVMMLDMYFLDENNEAVDTISTQYGDYTLIYDGTGITIKKAAGNIKISTTSQTVQNTINTTQNTATILQVHGEVAGFEIIAPSTAKKYDPIDVTIRAIDKNGQKVTSYTGSIIFISEMFGDTVPSPGLAIKFTAEDRGQKEFGQGLIFRTSGNQKIYVVDVDRPEDDISGEAPIFVN